MKKVVSAITSHIPALRKRYKELEDRISEEKAKLHIQTQFAEELTQALELNPLCWYSLADDDRWDSEEESFCLSLIYRMNKKAEIWIQERDPADPHRNNPMQIHLVLQHGEGEFFEDRWYSSVRTFLRAWKKLLPKLALEEL